MKKKIAVICASGIGDALVTSIATHHLSTQGWDVTTFNRHLGGFGKWLGPGSYLPPSTDWQKTLLSFDAALVQYDNTEQAKAIKTLRAQGFPVYIFYTNYRLSKHGEPLQGFDYLFNEQLSMVENTTHGTEVLFGGSCTQRNSLYPPPDLIHRKHLKRIAIHPTSSITTKNKNWHKSHYLLLFNTLIQKGFEPIFLVSPEERFEWNAPEFPTLESLASFLYESGAFIGNDSGPAHLASYLSLPHLVLRCNRSKELWRPGWHRGVLLTPPNFKIFESKWQYFITVRFVIKQLLKLIA